MIEDQIADMDADATVVEERILSRIQEYIRRRTMAHAEIREEIAFAVERDRVHRADLARDLTGYAEEFVTGIEYYPPPALFHESKLPHERVADPLKLYGDEE